MEQRLGCSIRSLQVESIKAEDAQAGGRRCQIPPSVRESREGTFHFMSSSKVASHTESERGRRSVNPGVARIKRAKIRGKGDCGPPIRIHQCR